MSKAPTRIFDGTTVIHNPVGYRLPMGGIRFSFVTADQGAIKIQIPFHAILTRVRSVVTSVLGATDVGTITFASPDGDIVELEHAISAAKATEESADLDHTDENNLFAAGADLTITSAKTTTGGKVVVDLDLLRVTGP